MCAGIDSPRGTFEFSEFASRQPPIAATVSHYFIFHRFEIQHEKLYLLSVLSLKHENKVSFDPENRHSECWRRNIWESTPITLRGKTYSQERFARQLEITEKLSPMIRCLGWLP
jgi:hypothetical protein